MLLTPFQGVRDMFYYFSSRAIWGAEKEMLSAFQQGDMHCDPFRNIFLCVVDGAFSLTV